MYTKTTKTQASVSKPNSLISQFQYENETWKRILVFLADENIELKTRLSEIVKNMGEGDGSLMERIEYFQNCFLREDEILGFLHVEVKELDKFLVRDIYEKGDGMKEVKRKHKKLSKDFERTEQEFNKLKFEFNSYLGEIL